MRLIALIKHNNTADWVTLSRTVDICGHRKRQRGRTGKRTYLGYFMCKVWPVPWEFRLGKCATWKMPDKMVRLYVAINTKNTVL